MGESTLEWAKRQKVSASQTSRTNAVCEDCGRKWTATLTEVPVTIFIKDLDEYYKKLSKNLLEAVEPEMVLCVFRPSDRDVTDSEVTLSVVAPRQDSPYHWRINHKFSGPAAASGCQITIWKADQSSASISHEVCIEPDIVTIKQEIKEEMKEEDELMVEEVDFDPLARHRIDDPDDPDPDWTNSDTDTEKYFGKNASKRSFATVSAEEIQKLRDERHEASTKKATLWGVNLFKEWLTERQIIDGLDMVSTDFEGYSKEFLDDLLSAFYPSIRTAGGTWYSKSSYVCARAAIQRHLSSDPWNVPYNIIDDPAFRNSNEVLGGIFKKLTREGVKNKQHKPIEGQDLEKLKSSGTIGTHNPRALQRLVWLNIALNFAKRGREGYRAMTANTFCVKVDGDGRQFIEHTDCENAAKHQGAKANLNDNYTPQGRIYEVKGDKYCPVRAFELYLTLLNPYLNCLWQKPDPRYLQTGSWYMKIPLGHNLLGNMMKSMCKDAKLTNSYTNHCTRVTATVMLNEQGFDKTDIITVTGHKNTSSVERYNDVATASKKREMSNAINNQLCKTNSQTESEHSNYY